MRHFSIKQKFIVLEVLFFVILLCIIWLNEIFDLPYHLMNANPTPVNWKEALLETILIMALAIIVIGITHHMLKKIRILEGMLPICASCKKIRDEKGYWKKVEQYIEENVGAKFSHGICEECAEKLYGKEEWYLKMKKKQENSNEVSSD